MLGQRERWAGRKEAQRRYPITSTDRCAACCGTETLQRHHKDRNPTNNAPENIEIVCVDCHAKEHRRVKPRPCVICRRVYQPERGRRGKLCPDPQCLKEMGRRSAALRWAS